VAAAWGCFSALEIGLRSAKPASRASPVQGSPQRSPAQR